MAESRKRKRADDGEPIFSLSADLLESDSRRPTPALAFRPGLTIPSTAGFSAFEDSRRAPGKPLLHAEHGRMEWETELDENGLGGYSYMLAIHRNSTDTTALMPVHAYTLLPSVVSHRGLHNGDDEPELTMEQQRARLGMTFGTKKAQKRIAALARNKIDVATEDLVELQPTLLDKIDAATASLPTVEKMKQESDAARPVPLYDVDATDPKRIYSQDDVVPPHEVKAVPLFGLLEAKTQEDRVKLLPFKRSRFVNDRLNAVVNEFGEVAPSGKQKKQLRLLYLVSAFMAFRAKKDGKQGPRTRLDDMDVPPAIITSVADRFSEKTKTGKASVTPLMQKKLDNYLVVLCLMVDHFNVDVGLLAEDLSISARILGETFRGLGCQVRAPSAPEYEKLQSQAKATGISVSVEKAARRAILTAPLTFPEIRKKRQSAAKR